MGHMTVDAKFGHQLEQFLVENSILTAEEIVAMKPSRLDPQNIKKFPGMDNRIPSHYSNPRAINHREGNINPNNLGMTTTFYNNPNQSHLSGPNTDPNPNNTTTNMNYEMNMYPPSGYRRRPMTSTTSAGSNPLNMDPNNSEHSYYDPLSTSGGYDPSNPRYNNPNSQYQSYQSRRPAGGGGGPGYPPLQHQTDSTMPPGPRSAAQSYFNQYAYIMGGTNQHDMPGYFDR
jgi:hypothetical protein